jgi:hypothetical protein
VSPSVAVDTPTLAAIPNQTNAEGSNPSLVLQGNDAQGRPLTYSVLGPLPSGLSLTGQTISGTIQANAATVTQNYNNIQTSSFNVGVQVSNGTHTASTSFTWTIQDTEIAMPNYIGKYGCAGDAGCSETSPPGVSKISHVAFACAYEPSEPPSVIVAQSVQPGTIITWGAAVTYTYSQTSPC